MFMDHRREKPAVNNLLEIRTLGSVAIRCGGQPVEGFKSQKVRAMLIYFTCTARPQPRMVLAELFWPELSEDRALANLRVALNNLRQTVGSYIHITRENAMVRPGRSPYLDSVDFEDRVTAALSTAGITSEDVVKDALALYRGDFLDGFYIDSAGFEDWVSLERERLRFLFFYASDRLIDYSLAEGKYPLGVEMAARALQIDPLREETHRQLMVVLAQSGQRTAALDQYHTCQRLLKDELDTAPSAETTHLYESLQLGDGSAPRAGSGQSAAAIRLPDLPPQPFSFVGRTSELTTLLKQLDEPACHLISILGPGGCGKTRLAVEVARRKADAFKDGVFFVALASVDTAETLVTSIANALGLRFQEGKTAPRDELLEYLSARQMLVLLDNFEQLVHAVDVITAIPMHAPDCKLLVTSRQALNLTWEWQFWLTGMNYPQSAAIEYLESYSAVQLFVERARRIRHAFTYHDDAAGIVQICQMVEGMPLGIEIAASWLRVMSCQQIAKELTRLEVPYEPVETRHRSLRALFENAWQRLSNSEQHTIMQLSVFRGGFRREAAEAVALTPVSILTAMVNQSVVNVNYLTRRFNMHPLFRDFVHEQLRVLDSEEQIVLERHASYYLAMINTLQTRLDDGRPCLTSEDILPEIDNLRAAWQWAVAHQRFDLISDSCKNLGALYSFAGLHHETLATFQDALRALACTPPSSDRDRLELALTMCLVQPSVVVLGWTSPEVARVAEQARMLATRLDKQYTRFQILLILSLFYGNAEWDRSLQVAEEALIIAQQSDTYEEIMARVTLETPLIFTGKYTLALEQTEHVLALADHDETSGSNTFLGVDPVSAALVHSGYIRCMLGHADQGLQSITAALRRAQSLEPSTATALGLGFTGLCYEFLGMSDKLDTIAAALEVEVNAHGFQHFAPFPAAFRGSALIQRRDFQAGIQQIEAALRISSTHGNLHTVPLRLAELGWAYANIGCVDQGLAELTKAEELSEKTGERQHQAEIFRLRGELLKLRGDRANAESSFQQAIMLARRQDARLLELWATLSLCRLLQEDERASEAHGILSAIFDWFSKGLDAPVLAMAHAQLHQLTSDSQEVE